MKNKLKALEGMGYSKSEEWKKKDDAIALRRQQIGARTKMPAREREAAEDHEAQARRREHARQPFEKNGMLDDIGEIFSDIFSDDNQSKKPKNSSGEGHMYGRPRPHTFLMK